MSQEDFKILFFNICSQILWHMEQLGALQQRNIIKNSIFLSRLKKPTTNQTQNQKEIRLLGKVAAFFQQ